MGYRRTEESGLSVSKYFSEHDLRLRVGQEMPPVSRAQTVRHEALRPVHLRVFFCATGTACQPRPAPGLLDTLRALDTLPTRLWWPGRAVARLRQTGNTGVNPGRPRRCDQAPRSAVSKPLRTALRCGLREKACSRPSLGVRRPTRVAEQAFLARAGVQARPQRSDPVRSDIRLSRNHGCARSIRHGCALALRAAQSPACGDPRRPRRCAWTRGPFIPVRRHHVAA